MVTIKTSEEQENKLIEKFLEEVEHILYLDQPVTNKEIAKKIFGILEREYDI